MILTYDGLWINDQMDSKPLIWRNIWQIVSNLLSSER